MPRKEDTNQEIISTPYVKILFIFFFFIFIKGILWTWVIPPFMVPDESAHFAYTQYLVEEKQIPHNTVQPSVWNRSQSEELKQALELTENQDVILTTQHQSYYKVSKDLTPSILTADRNTPHEQYHNSAAVYSPLYYVIESIPYLAGYDLNIFHRLYLMRAFSLVFLFITTIFAYKISFLVTKDKSFALVIAAIANLMPSVNATSFAGVNNDAILIALSHALFFYLLLVLFNKMHITKKTLFGMGILLGFTLLTKTQAIIFLPITFGTYIYWGVQQHTIRRSFVYGILVCGIALLIATPFMIPQLFSHLTDTQITATETAISASTLHLAVFQDIFRRLNISMNFWTQVAFFDTLYPLWISATLLLFMLLALWGVLLWLISKKSGNNAHLLLSLIFFFCSFVVLEIFYSALYYNSALKYQHFDFPGQGRYYFMLLAPILILFLFGLRYWLKTLFKVNEKLLYAVLIIFFSFLHNYALINIALQYHYL